MEFFLLSFSIWYGFKGSSKKLELVQAITELFRKYLDIPMKRDVDVMPVVTNEAGHESGEQMV